VPLIVTPLPPQFTHITTLHAHLFARMHAHAHTLPVAHIRTARALLDLGYHTAPHAATLFWHPTLLLVLAAVAVVHYAPRCWFCLLTCCLRLLPRPCAASLRFCCAQHSACCRTTNVLPGVAGSLPFTAHRAIMHSLAAAARRLLQPRTSRAAALALHTLHHADAPYRLSTF